MLNLVFGACATCACACATCTVPVTNLRIELRASRQLIKKKNNEQVRLNLPGLIQECKNLSRDLQIENSFMDKSINNLKFKRIVKCSIAKQNQNELSQMMTKSKCEEVVKESFGLKSYIEDLNTTEARIKFRAKTRMLEAKFNFRNNAKYAKQNWICESCERDCIESQSHIMWCEAYSHLRDGIDLKNDKDLVRYLSNVMTIRQELQLIR